MRSYDERGASESVQWAVLTPLLILVVVGGIQSGIWLHGRTLAAEAAAAAAEQAATTTGSTEAARAVARRVCGDLRNVQVDIVDDGREVQVTVTGRTQTFLDLGQGRVQASATQPKEPR